MVISNTYRNAFKEVYIILSYLNKEEYKKISPEVLEAIDKNKENEYVFSLNEDLALKDQTLLPETRAILFNLYRDYLCSEQEKIKIKSFEQEARDKIEENKKIKYGVDVFQQNNNAIKQPKTLEKVEQQEKLELIESKKNFIQKLIYKIKKFLKTNK